MDKLHIHKWAKFSQANYFAVYAAQQIVSHADLTYQLIQKVRSRELDRLLPGIVSDEQWLHFYRDHRAVTKAISFLYDSNRASAKKVSTLKEGLDISRLISTWASTDPEDFKSYLVQEFPKKKVDRFIRLGLKKVDREYKKSLERMQDMASNKMQYQEADSHDAIALFDEHLRESPAFLFYFRVALPCMCVYRKFPLTVLRMAQREAICELRNKF